MDDHCDSDCQPEQTISTIQWHQKGAIHDNAPVNNRSSETFAIVYDLQEAS